jgi:mannose-1-phosphate guanylyltransferase / mannose-6-phosphate isomerase
MEKTLKSAVYAVDYEWRDIGLWDAVHELLPQDNAKNAIAGRGVIVNGKNNLVYSTDMLTALTDVDDLIVVVTDGAVLIAKRGQSENVKPLVTHLQKLKMKEAD